MASTSLTVFFPCYNDALTIGGLVEAADRVASEFTRDYELIVVDDGSRDGSLEVLRALGRRFPRLHVFSHGRNLGYGAALASGFRNATRDWVFYTDGDGQYDVSELRQLLERIGPDVDLVNGYKRSRSDPWYRIVIGRTYQGVIRAAFGTRIRDLSCDFRLVRRSVFDSIALGRESGAVCVELVAKIERAGFRAQDCPVHHYPRPHGKSQFFRPRHLWATACDLLGLWRELKWKTANTSR